MSVESVMEELHPGYAARKRKAAEKDRGIAFVGDDDHEKEGFIAEDTPSEEPPKTKGRKPRAKKEAKGIPFAEELTGASMYTMSVVGGIGLPGYPLNKGEKLVIAKLTPIAISQ